MTDSNEVKESSEDKPELVKDMDVGDEKHKEGREEVEEDDEEEDDDEEDIEEDTEESDEDEEDEHEKEVQPGSEDVSDDSRNELNAEVSLAKNPNVNTGSPSDAVGNRKADGGDEKEALRPDTEDGGDAKLDGHDSHTHQSVNDEITPRSHTGVDAHINGSSALKVELMEEDLKNEANTKEGTMDVENGHPNVSCIFDTDTSGGGESGTEDEQAAFMNELEKFHKEKLLEFKPPKFYGEPLNLLKLWRAVMRLGGYDKVTACKYWRQVGESFKPPKTCTTVSWTFRIFYEKALLEYERYRTSGDGTGIPTSLTVPMSVENQVSGSGRARRDAAARAMQGWHSQRILDNGEVSDPIIKDKNTTSLSKRDKQLKNLGMLKRKKPSSMDAAVKDVRAKVPKTQLRL